MTKVLKIIALVGAAMIAVGTVLAITGAVFGGSRYLFSATNSHVPENDRQEALEPFSAISIEGSMLNVELRPSNSGYSIQLLFSSGLPEPIYKVNNGVLTVTSNWPHRNNFLNIGNRYYDVIIYYPQGTVFDDVTIDLSLCELQLEEFEAKRLMIEASVADIDITESALGQLEIDGSTVDINIDNTTAERARIDGSVGDIDGEAFDTKELTLDVNIGDIYISGTMEGTTRVTTNAGDITLTPTLSPELYYSYIKKSASEYNKGTLETAKNTIYVTTNVGDIGVDYIG